MPQWQASLLNDAVEALMPHDAPVAGATAGGAAPAPLDVYRAERKLAVARDGDLQYDVGDIIVRVGDAPERNTDSEQWSLGYKAKDPSREAKLFRTGFGCCVEKLGLAADDVAQLTESTVDGLTAVDTASTEVTGTPTAMMLCNDDGSEKHTRWFRIDANTHTLHWAKKPSGSGKHPQLTACTQRACERRLTFETSDGEVSAIAESPAVARAWAQACTALLDSDLDAYTVMRTSADIREGEDLQLVVGDTIVRVGPAPNWSVGYVLGREPREAKLFPTGPVGYLHQIGPEDLCELTALQLEGLCGSGVDAPELTVVQPDEGGAEPQRYSISGKELLRLTQSVPGLPDPSDEEGEHEDDHAGAEPEPEPEGDLTRTTSKAEYRTPFEQPSPSTSQADEGKLTQTSSLKKAELDQNGLMSEEKRIDLYSQDDDAKKTQRVSVPLVAYRVYAVGDLVEVFEDGEWVKGKVYALAADNTVTCTITVAGVVSYREDLETSDEAALRPRQAPLAQPVVTVPVPDPPPLVPLVKPTQVKEAPLVVHLQPSGTGEFLELQLESAYPHATFVPGGTLSLRRAVMTGAKISSPNNPRPGHEVAIRVDLVAADNQGCKKYIISPSNPAHLARLKVALSPPARRILLNSTVPEAVCRKQKPTLTTAWPYRYAKVDGKSLLFFDGATEQACRLYFDTQVDLRAELPKSNQPRGSSIMDLTGCTIEVGRENFACETSTEDRGTFHKVSVTRKGHANGLPDMKGDGTSRFCFKQEFNCEQFAAALTNMAAGRAWNIPEPESEPQPVRGSREGPMEKQGKGLNSDFRPRYFRLDGSKLAYFECSDSHAANGSLDMSTAVSVQRPGVWSWQSSRSRNEWTRYSPFMCSKLEDAHREAQSDDDADLMHGSVSFDDRRYIDMRQMCQVVRDDPTNTREVRRQEGAEIVVKALRRGSQKSGQFAREWRIWRFKCTGTNGDAVAEASLWEESLRLSMDAKECTAIIGGVTVELNTPGVLNGREGPCSVQPDEAGLMHLGVVQADDGAAQYQLYDLQDVVSETEPWWGGKYRINAKVQLQTQTAPTGDQLRDSRSTLTLRFDKSCEANRDRVLVAIGRATPPAPERPSLSEQLQSFRSSMSGGADGMRQSVESAAGGLVKVAGRWSGGGAVMSRGSTPR